jgi:hypothetical protein
MQTAMAMAVATMTGMATAYRFKVLLAVCPAKYSDFFLFPCQFLLRRTREWLI